jgi:hypothetical protein
MPLLQKFPNIQMQHEKIIGTFTTSLKNLNRTKKMDSADSHFTDWLNV